MVFSLLLGTIVGFVLAVPPGPVGVTTLKAGLRGDERTGVLIGFGAGVMDFFYCLFAMLATSAISSSLQSFFSEYPLAIIIFQVLCVLILVGYGILELRNARTSHCQSTQMQPSRLRKAAERLKKNGPFFIGVAIALMNIANPTFLPSLAYTSMLIQHSSFFDNTILNCLMFSVGFGFGNFGWLYALLRVVLYYKERFSPEFTLRIHRFAGFTMIGAGTLLGYRVIFTKWPEIARLLFAV